MNQIKRLMIEADRRARDCSFYVDALEMGLTIADTVTENIEMELDAMGETDTPVDWHYLMGPNYVPEIEINAQIDDADRWYE